MPSSFETWYGKDEAWVQQNRDVLGHVFQWFLDKGDWPEIEPFQRYLYQRLEDEPVDVRVIAAAKPQIPTLRSPLPSNISLQSRHLIYLPKAAPLLRLATSATEAAVDVYLLPGSDEHPQVTRSMMEAKTGGTPSLLELLPKLFNTDWPAPFSGGSYSGDWSMAVVNALVMKFKGVQNPMDYVGRQHQIIKEWCDDMDAKLGMLPKDGPLKAFVVMPIGNDWSDSVHAFIKEAVRSFGDELSAIRADEIVETGRINDQIIRELEECDFVIGDVTFVNQNVAWELGFAYAFDKPCVLLRSTDSPDPVPFDFYDHRRVDYSPERSVTDKERLVAMIQNAIEKVRSTEPGQVGGQ